MFRHEYSIEDLSSIFSQPFITEDDQQQQQQPHFIPSQLSKLQQHSLDQLATTSDDIDAVHHNIYSRTALNGDKGASRAPSKRVITKRFGRKKDRHSKITTAQGVRDRRMRLSLEVAHKFFTLQDMLGLDKASKTVEWLLTMSKSAIKELAHQESVSHHNPSVDDDQIEKRKKEGGVLSCKSAAFDHPTVKESRAKRRERARERTIEKMRNRTEETCVSHSQVAVHDQACPNIIEDSFMNKSSGITQISTSRLSLNFINDHENINVRVWDNLSTDMAVMKQSSVDNSMTTNSGNNNEDHLFDTIFFAATDIHDYQSSFENEFYGKSCWEIYQQLINPNFD